MTETSDKPAPLAVVGSQISYDEELFGKVFDRWVIARFWEYMKPYKRRILLAVVGVLVFTFTQLAIPLIIRWAIDDAVANGPDARALLHSAVIVFFGIIAMNYIANQVQESIVGRLAGHLLFDLRRAMYAHLQIVSLSFMDRTEVGRLLDLCHR